MENTQIKPEKTAKSMPKWEADVRDKLKAAIKKFSKPLADLAARDANEGDTRLLITDFLCDGLGYDKYSDLTTEYRVKGEFADFGIRIDKEMTSFIEVKRVNTKLGQKHLRQVESYAVNEGVEWMILTNGAVWQVYHLTGGLPIQVDLAIDVDLLNEETINEKAKRLFFITREAMKRKLIDAVWQARRATSPKSLAQIICSEPVADIIRRELKKTTNHIETNENIIKFLKETVIRGECL